MISSAMVVGIRITFAVLLYSVLDLSSPFVPGAFMFDPDTGVDAISRVRDGGDRASAAVSMPSSPRRDLPSERPRFTISSVRRSPVVNEWLADLRQAHAALPDVRTVSEDH